MSGVPSSTPRLKQWMIEQVDSERYPGLVWEDRNLGMFRIPWKHANHQDYRHDKDAAIFEAWARFKGPCRDWRSLNPRTWKSRLRCALHKSSDFVEVPERSQLHNFHPYKVYRIIDSSFSQERPSLAIDLSTVKVEESGSAGMESSQPSSPSRGVVTSHQQVKSEGPAPTSQQAESDSSCDPSSDSERSIPKECSVGSPLPDPELDPCVEVRTWSDSELSVKREEESSGGEKDVLPLTSSGQLGMLVQAPGNMPARGSARAEGDSNGEPRSDSKVSAQEEGPDGAPRMECSPTPSAEVTRNCTVNINPTPANLPEKSSTSLRCINNFTINIGGPSDRVPHNYTVNIHCPPLAGPTEKAMSSYTINIGSPTLTSLPDRAVNSYTINIGSPSPVSRLDRVGNSYTINIGNTTPASLPDTESGNL
ncbi:interferon regulatory factor 1-like isoform X6 [Hemiscyllium ocellatum]|uniref:interferon regulatory factor 1-like isoform X6 n=1 Tax=Hemiscyllium ocellatum TaxID=170820 RepID=UPI00296719FD|nr:interferon regulatory factor 1-like isoform X6 [Hemiscyllium ocellatum]